MVVVPLTVDLPPANNSGNNQPTTSPRPGHFLQIS